MSYDFPAGPTPGQEFTPPLGGQTYVWVPPRWLVKGIPPAGPGTVEPGVGEAPIDGVQYGRQDAQWTEVEAADWATLTGKPATFPYATPIPQANVANLTTDLASLDTRLDTSEATDITHNTAISQLQAKDTVHDTRLTNLEGDTTDWSELTGKPATFPPTLPIAQAGVTNLSTDLASKVNDTGDTMTGKLQMKASDTVSAPINIPQGVSPSAPADGDIWMNGTTLTVRGTGTSYATAYLNGSSTFTGIKTFTAKPIMTIPTTGTGSVNLPHGVAPTAPADGDMWTTSAGLYVRINGATVGPLTGAAAAGVAISDTAPGSPVTGQLWFESDTGRTYIWYNDGNSSQWVMIAPGGAPATPFVADTNGDAVVKFGSNIMVRIKPSGLIMTKDDIEIFSVSV